MNLSAKTALLIEGKAHCSHRIVSFLKPSGLQVDCAETAGQALGKILGRRPDIILLDLHLPGMDGAGMLRTMSEIDNPPPVIIISTKNVLNAQARSRYPFVMAAFDKPITDLNALQHAIEHSLSPGMERRRMQPREVSEVDLTAFSDPGVAVLSQQLIFQAAKVARSGCLARYSVLSKAMISQWFVSHVELNEHSIGGFIAYMPADDHQAAFVSLMLQTYLNSLRRRRKRDQQLVMKSEFILNSLAKEVADSGLDVPVQLGFFTYDSQSREISLAIVGSEIKAYLRQGDHLNPMMLRSGRSLVDKPLVCASITRNLEPDTQLVLFGGDKALKPKLLNDEFSGFNETLHQGAYIQVESIS
ncbi:response regulator [Ferrimonas kyonanensis]|uniref:response regulator n=1 Tax=Ferrimonas kyonanensis TaxID=364763 RepID=UPI00146DFBEC|nr:response regulator [Ferrimonas kyonanensis]